MAKGKIFIGEIMGDQVEALDSMQTAMASQTVSMEEMTNRLIAIGENTSQSVQSISIKSGTIDGPLKSYSPVSEVDLTNKNASTPSGAFAYHKIGSFKSMASGTFAFNMTGATIYEITGTLRGLLVQLVVKVDGVTKATGSQLTKPKTSTPITYNSGLLQNIIVENANTVEYGFEVKTTTTDQPGSARFVIPADAAYISYALLDKISGGGFINL